MIHSSYDRTCVLQMRQCCKQQVRACRLGYRAISTCVRGILVPVPNTLQREGLAAAKLFMFPYSRLE